MKITMEKRTLANCLIGNKTASIRTDNKSPSLVPVKTLRNAQNQAMKPGRRVVKERYNRKR